VPVVTPAPAPAPVLTPLLCVSGQSNAYKLLPFLGTPTSVSYGQETTGNELITFMSPTAQGFAAGGETINYWNPGSPGWARILPTLSSSCQAFVWAQGEADDDLESYNQDPPGGYRLDLADLISRVRGMTAPTLPVLVVQLAPHYTRVRVEQAAACSSLTACRMVPTDDLSFPDGTHLDDPSYRLLAQRIVTMVR